jgi:hypothetical protein
MSDWTTETLKELMEQRFVDQDKAVQAALLAAKEAVLKAETATEKRFEASNEFRAQLADQTATFIPRPEFTAKYGALEDKVSALTDRLNKSQGEAEGSQLTKGNIYAALAAAVGIISLIVLLANGVFK